MRGKAVNGYVTFLHVGITPAYAGKSLFKYHSFALLEDHPRLCGEKSEPENCDMNNQGSPPPMRGKVTEVEDENGYKRITPAYAGKRIPRKRPT